VQNMDPADHRDEAADWFAAMRGPDADTKREEFEAWLAATPLNRRAYNNIAETFHVGRSLFATAPATRSNAHRGWLVAIIIACLASAAAAIFIFQHMLDRQLRAPMLFGMAERIQAQPQYQTRAGEIRTFTLPDGSHLTLDSASALAIRFDQGSRLLRLDRGRARFDVEHEQRPFTVFAGETAVTAHGTIFDVARLDHAPVRVHLLRGAIEVREIGPKAIAPQAAVEMKAGEDLLFEPKRDPLPAPSSVQDDRWPTGVVEYDNQTLRQLAADAGRYSRKPIILDGAALGDLRVSGTFRLQDTRRLADHLALLLNLSFTETDRGYELSTRCDENISLACMPPS
jgi:transmembrane sensor